MFDYLINFFNPALSIKNLKAGLVFCYLGPIDFFSLRAGLAVGKILDFDLKRKVAHVRTYLPSSPHASESEIDVHHMPISFPSLFKSARKIAGINIFPIDEVTDGLIKHWEKGYDQGKYGAFVVSMWEAEQFAKDILGDAHKNGKILSCYPVLNDKGAMTKVEVVKEAQ